jgi:hypothetical protein
MTNPINQAIRRAAGRSVRGEPLTPGPTEQATRQSEQMNDLIRAAAGGPKRSRTLFPRRTDAKEKP